MLGRRLVHGVTLKRFRRLAELQIKANSIPLVMRDIWRIFDNHVRLVQAEGIAAYVVRAE